MPIETMSGYYPKMALPLYTKITDPKYNTFDVGEVYDMRVEDVRRSKEKEEGAPFNYTHQSLLVAKRELNVGEVEGPLLAFDTHTTDPREAGDRLVPGDTPIDRDLVLLVFLRLDMAEKFVEDYEAVFTEKMKDGHTEFNMDEMDKQQTEE